MAPEAAPTAAAPTTPSAQAPTTTAPVVSTPTPTPLVISGWSGGVLHIRGKGFGIGGSLTIGGHNITTTKWDDDDIRGTVPVGVKGAVIITARDGTVQKGTFPHKE